MSYERERIARMSGYVPGAQPSDPTVVKLNTNENPYPPAPEVLAALGRVGAEQLRRYPPPTAQDLRARVAQLHGLEPDNVVIVNGGDELLRLALTTFVEPGQPIGIVEPSYSLYPVLARIHGSEVVSVPAPGDWSLPAHLAARMNEHAVALTLLVNPHAPSGRLAPLSEVTRLARQLDGVLLVDEAYVDFVDPNHGYDLPAQLSALDNVLVLRSLSKGYSLAGLRVGYGLGAASLVEPIRDKTRDSYNVDAIAQVLADAALGARAHAQRSWQAVREERARLSRALEALGFDVAPSEANFVLARVRPGGPNAAQLQRDLEQAGVVVRYFDAPRLQDALRITVGTPEQNDRLLRELDQRIA